MKILNRIREVHCNCTPDQIKDEDQGQRAKRVKDLEISDRIVSDLFNKLKLFEKSKISHNDRLQMIPTPKDMNQIQIIMTDNEDE